MSVKVRWVACPLQLHGFASPKLHPEPRSKTGRNQRRVGSSPHQDRRVAGSASKLTVGSRVTDEWDRLFPWIEAGSGSFRDSHVVRNGNRQHLGFHEKAQICDICISVLWSKAFQLLLTKAGLFCWFDEAGWPSQVLGYCQPQEA